MVNDFILADKLLWKTHNEGANNEHPFGKLYSPVGAELLQKDGWRIPREEELYTLFKNYRPKNDEIHFGRNETFVYPPIIDIVTENGVLHFPINLDLRKIMHIKEPHGLYHAVGRAHFAFLGYLDDPYLLKFWKKRISFRNYYPTMICLSKIYNEKYNRFLFKRNKKILSYPPQRLIYAYVRLVKDIM